MNALAALLANPPSWFPIAILVVVVLLLVVVALSLWWLLRRRQDEEAEAAEETAQPLPGPEAEEGWFVARMRAHLRKTLTALAEMTGIEGTPYGVPWIVVAGIEGAAGWALVEGIGAASGHTGQIPRAATVRFCRRGAVFHAGDDLLAQPAGLRRWRRLLGLLRLCRIHRPVDGLVIVIPASALDGPEALPYDRLADKGAQLYELVATAQSRTGLRMPVTIAISGCERMQGFDSLVTSLTPALRHQALGWAVPYSLDTAFQAEWADEAVDAIATGLSHLGVQALMARERAPDPDGLMVLPSGVRAMAPRLKVLLASMFQPSAYQEAFLFRGIYLTGAEPDGQGTAFAAGLFDDKVFAEHQLVRPVRGLLTVRNRRVRIAQAVAAALVLSEAAGLWWLSVDIPDRVANLTPMLSSIDGDLRQLARGGDGAGPGFVQAASLRLLQAMVRVDVETVTTPLAPTSFVSRPDADIEQAIAVGYDTLVMRELRHQMERRLPTILAEELQNLRPDGDVGAQVAHAAGRLAEFDDTYSTYLDLQKAGHAGALASLVRYAMDIELPPGFQQRARLYQAALAYSTVKPIDGLGDQAERGLRALFTAAYRARFDERGLRRRLERIAQLSRDGGDEHNPEAAMARLTELQKQLQAVTRELDLQSYGWINGSSADLGAGFDEALQRIDKARIVRAGTGAALRDMGVKRLAEARQALFSLLATQSMPLLHLEDGKAVLAPGMVTLKKQLDELMVRPFMAEALPQAPTLPTGSRPILWDGQWLKSAQRLLDDYLAFTGTDALRLPPELAFAAELAAFDQVNQRAATALSLAARSGDRNAGAYQVETELRALASASQQLAGIAEQMRRAKMEGLAVQLEGLMQAQAGRLLAEVDAMGAGLLLAERVPPFDWWDGTLPFAARTFRAASTAELTLMVEGSRESLSQIARDYAGPLIRVMSTLPATDGRSRELVTKWQGIVRALARYDQKAPDSSLRRLEQFILADMDQIDPGRCDGLAGPPAGIDLFGRQLDELKAAIGKRCGELGGERVRRVYGRIHDLFNDTLAGRFPFAADPRPATPRADPAAVRRFFFSLAQEKAPPRAALDVAVGRRGGVFLTSLGEAQRALSPMLVDPTLEAPLVYEVEAEFRTNGARDQGGNQIIEWVLDLGADQRLSSAEPKKKAVWATGQPVRLTVRFARNAPGMPAPDPRGRYKVDGMSATWEAADPWALLSLMASLAAEPGRLAELPDRRPHALRLAVEMQRNPDAVSGPRVAPNVEAYLRLGLAAVVRVPGKPEEKQPVVLPVFPPAAPDAEIPGRVVPVWQE